MTVPLRSFALRLIFSLFLSLAGARADTTVTLDAANEAYGQGRYDEAITLFQQLIESQGYSASLCFNLANAEAKAGHAGQAILNYERARYLAPGDTDIDHNLQLARKQAGLDPNSYRWWQIVLRSLSGQQWLYIVDGWLVLIALAILTHCFAPRVAAMLAVPLALLRKVVKTVLFIAIPLALFFGYVSLLASPTRIEGVIIAKDVVLHRSPFASSESTGSIPEGELVTVEERHDPYFWIEGRNHLHGWLQRKEIEPVIPGSFDTKP